MRQLSLLILYLYTPFIAASEFSLSEDALIKMVHKSNPSLQEIEASFLSSKVQAQELEDNFGYELYTGYKHQATNEKGIISFQPVFSSVNQYQLGVRKYTKYGIVLDAHRSVDDRSAKQNYTNLTTISDEVGVQMDLWKDFMGSLTKSRFDNVQDLQKKDKLQETISKSVLENNLRRLYWSIVANNEKLKITKNLHKAAIKQAADAKRRRANSISDKAEVARFQSLVHQRKGSILALEYEREVLFKNLRDLLPGLNGHTLKLSDYNVNKVNFEVLGCSAQIDKEKEIPYNHTTYDEITKLLKKIQSRQQKIDKSYGNIDLKFELKLKRTGVASETEDGTSFSGDYALAREDMMDNDRGGMTAGLMLTIPFGENKGSTAKVKEVLSEKQFSSQIHRLEANIKSTHGKVQKAVRLLGHVIAEQKANSKQLSIRVREMKKKYAQARIPEYALIQDENSLLQSDLDIVDTQLLVVNTILDYLSVFNTYPCAFNRI